MQIIKRIINFNQNLPFLLSEEFSNFFLYINTIENFLLKKKLKKEIYKPIFITGLARSGTTIISHILNNHSNTGSFLYKDVPFFHTPYFWSFFSKLFYFGISKKKRPHGDDISIDPNSPDPFEEFFWKNNLENYLNKKSQYLNKKYKNLLLERKLKENISKILFVRGSKERYISKNNYNITRLEYIFKIFPDAKAIICIRNPIESINSLTRVHQKFLNYCKKNEYLVNQLNFLSHYEFGPNRKPICINNNIYNKINYEWDKGNQEKGYLLQWIDIYTFVLKKYLSNKNLKKKFFILDNDELIKNPINTIKKINIFFNLKDNDFFNKKITKLIKKKKKNYFCNIDDNLKKKSLKIYKTILNKNYEK